MSAATAAPSAAPPAARAKWRVIAGQMVPAWGRVVVVIAGAALAAKAFGLDNATGYAVIPGVYLVMAPPAGSLRTRAGTTALACVVTAALVFVGAELSGSPPAIVVGLTVMGFAAGLLPRVGPRAAAMQLPLLLGFAYSAAFPLSEASAASRAAAVLVTLPVYVLAAAVVFQTDAWRPLLLGASAALEAIGAALGMVEADPPAAGRAAESALVRFRVATARMKDAALPTGAAPESRAARLLMAAVQRLVTAVELLAAGDRRNDPRASAWLTALGRDAHGLAAALARGGPAPPPGPLEAIAREAAGGGPAVRAAGGPGNPTAAARDPAVAAGDPGDPAVAAVAGALADAAHAVAVLRGDAREIPAGALPDLPGAARRVRLALTPEDPVFRRALRLAAAVGLAALTAVALDLTRTYWAVFAAVVVLNAPAALDRRRAVMRIAGTAAGFVVAIAVVAVVGHHATAAIAVGLALLLPGMLLMPVNYAFAVLFITAAVGTIYSATGEEADFLSFRVLDNAVGVAVVGVVSVLLWRTTRADWWRSAGLTATSLAAAVGSADRARHRDVLMTRALQLRTETVEAAALPDAAPSPAAWTYVAAAEDLVRMVLGPAPPAPPGDDPRGLARRLRAIAARCHPAAEGQNGDGARDTPPPSTLATVDVTRMARAAETVRATEAA